MSEYVENGYVESGYAEGDTSLPSEPTDCNIDLTAVMSDMALIKEQLAALTTHVTSTKTLSLAMNDKLIALQSSINALEDVTSGGTQIDTTELVTKDFFMAKIPFANDKHLDVYPNGTIVKIRYLPAIYTVFSSRFVPVPDNYHTFNLIYTVHKNINGVDYYSDYHSSDVIDINPDEWVYNPPALIDG